MAEYSSLAILEPSRNVTRLKNNLLAHYCVRSAEGVREIREGEYASRWPSALLQKYCENNRSLKVVSDFGGEEGGSVVSSNAANSATFD